MSATARLRRPAGAWSIALGLLLVVGVGCDKLGQVSGTVSYRGRPLPNGTVVLLDSDGQAHHGRIGPDGRYAIPKVPRGEARVAVTSLVEESRSSGRAGNAGNARVGVQAPRYSRIPMQYSDLTQSGLTTTIEGDGALDLDLK